jgi:hypothetical protein
MGVVCWTLGVLAACSGSSGSKPDAGSQDASDVAVADLLADVPTELPTEQVEEPGHPDVPDLFQPEELLPETDSRICSPGEGICSDDGLILMQCNAEGDAVSEIACMVDFGKLCENGACVDPWNHGSPDWTSCPVEPLATAETLAEKAAYFDALTPRLHIHPMLGWAAHVTLPKVEVECSGDNLPPCYAPSVPESEATWEDVESWSTGENDGLWSGLYMASQAFRYAATGSPQALIVLRTLMEGQRVRMAITGVPGVFTRQFIPPGVPGIACPQDLNHYMPDVEKDDNQWVRVSPEGCVQTVEKDTFQWVTSSHCGLEEFAGYCWLDNVSQDEYAGHMMALVAVWKLVDDVDLKNDAARMLEDIAVHLMENDLTFVDWDGRITEHGWMFPASGRDFPGFAAAYCMPMILAGAEASGRADLRDYYDNCLMQKAGPVRCIDWPAQPVQPFTDFLPLMMLYLGDDACRSNWNNFSMVFSMLHVLLMLERDPGTRRIIQDVLDTEVYRHGSVKDLAVQGNPWFNIMWAASKTLGPDSDGPAIQAVDDAICALKQFPASKRSEARDSASLYPHYCEDRLGKSLAEHVVPVSQRCPATFLWWGNPYSRQTCAENHMHMRVPGDYLLAYWMGRYYGMIGEDL